MPDRRRTAAAPPDPTAVRTVGVIHGEDGSVACERKEYLDPGGVAFAEPHGPALDVAWSPGHRCYFATSRGTALAASGAGPLDAIQAYMRLWRLLGWDRRAPGGKTEEGDGL